MFPPSPITQQSNEAGYIFFILWSIVFFYHRNNWETVMFSNSFPVRDGANISSGHVQVNPIA